MGKFRKKPLVVEAVQWTGNNVEEIHQLAASVTLLRASNRPSVGELLIFRRAGKAVQVADLHDWIICDVKGELYPCKPDIFAAIYEPVDESNG
jgi:hypothetical protein